MTTTAIGLDAEQVQTTHQKLQGALTNLIKLALQTKQGHWNLKGSRFRSVHLQLDEIVVDLRDHVDAVAERITTLDGDADGRVETVHQHATIPDLPAGALGVREVVSRLANHLGRCIHDLREAIPVLGECDPISQDLVISVVACLEKHRWMLNAQLRND